MKKIEIGAVALENSKVKSKDKKSLEGSQIDILFNELFSNLLNNEGKLADLSSKGRNDVLKHLSKNFDMLNGDLDKESLLTFLDKNSDKMNLFKNLKTSELNNLFKNIETTNLNDNEIKNIISKLDNKALNDKTLNLKDIKELLIKVSKNNENKERNLMNELNLLSNSKKIKNGNSLDEKINTNDKSKDLDIKHIVEKTDKKISKKNIKTNEIKDIDKEISKFNNLNRNKLNKNEKVFKNKNAKTKDILGEKIKVIDKTKDNTNTDSKEMLNKNFEFEKTVKNTSTKTGNTKHTKLQNLDEVSMKMTQQAKSLSEGKESTLKVSLRPKELGDIEIKLNMKNGLLEGKIMVSNEEAKYALDKQLQLLKNNLKTQNVDLQNIEVDVNKDFSEFSKGKKDNQTYQQGKSFKGSKKSKIKDDEINLETVSDISYKPGYKRINKNNSLNLLA
ncbi:MAG: flagellar hook-length control protein FliK [Firmicutes bacterium]|nr:flagellar hook-length control protein FliK [Bacillota bacterium]